MKTDTHQAIAAALAPRPERPTVTQRLLAAAKARQGIPSNYRLARVLDVADTTMTRWSQGRGSAADSIAVTLADMAGLDAGLILVELAAERAQDDVTRGRLQGVVERLKAAGLAAICGIAIAFGAPSPEAQASEIVHVDQSGLCVMSIIESTTPPNGCPCPALGRPAPDSGDRKDCDDPRSNATAMTYQA